MCISDCRTYEAAFIEDSEPVRVDSVPGMKILGVNFSNKPDISLQVGSICRKMRSRTWMLRYLHHNGFAQDKLLKSLVSYHVMTIAPTSIIPA